jgi:uncharacterized protein (DUF58 family)
MPPDTPRGTLFSESFLKRLEQLVVAGRKLYAGTTSGRRRSRRLGDGVEFADHRAYFPGDDLRYIDWNVYARTERLLLRLFHEEADLLVHLVVDASGSMALGGRSESAPPRSSEGAPPNAHRRRRWVGRRRAAAPATPKFDHARRIAAALAHVALANLDRVAIWWAAQDAAAGLPPLGGMARRPRVLEFLAAMRPSGSADLAQAAERIVARRGGRGMAVLISDFLDVGDVARALDRLHVGGIETAAVQTLAPEEIAPPFRGRVDFLDAEDGATRRLQITPALREAYLAELRARLDALDRLCAARDTTLVRTITTDPVDVLLLKTFRLAGLLT